MRRLPPLNSLRAFEAAARLGSFTLAAEELCVTHGAVSRHVQQLEAWLGHALFERYNRRIALTEAGRLYLAEVSAAFDRLALATHRQLEQGRRVLRVNAPATFSLRWLVPRLSAFQLQHPGIEVRLSTSNEAIARVSSEVDVVIRGGPQQVEGSRAREFLTEVRLPVCAPRLLKQKKLLRVQDLARHTLLHAAPYPTMWPQWLALSGHATLRAAQSITLEHFYLTLQAALDGLGVAMGPTALVADDVAEGRLVYPFAAPCLPAWRYFTYLPQARGDDAATSAFSDWLLQAGETAALPARA